MSGERRVGRRAALATIAGAGAALVVTACGGGSSATSRNAATLAAQGSSTPAPGTSTGGVEGGPEPLLSGPAAKYAPAQAELTAAYKVAPNETYGMGLDTYAASTFFPGATEGKELATGWGFGEGYQVMLEPDGLLAGVLKGGYFVTAEVYLFHDQAGAKAAFDYYRSRYDSTAGSESAPAKGLANQSGGWQLIKGPVGTSSLVGVYHRFVFRRGNMLASVQTYGAQPFMTVDKARDIAVIIDERALGTRQATEPTPAGTTVPGLPR
ncbi:MAG: hypothetical protein DYG91_14100 [Chloroflexi bacterium CFX7]|nr:hypothetical protein [Chloroflexi bacterium CFX7]